MRVLVTGFSGFLGSTIVSRLKKNKIEVLTIGRNEKADIIWDFIQPEPNLPILDMVVHCVGLAHLKPYSYEEGRFMKVNYETTVNLCKALVKMTKIPPIFVFISSVAVYGLETGDRISEEMKPKPFTPYGKSKLAAEEFLGEWGKKFDIKILILRLPLVVGTNPPGNLGAMIKAIKSGYYFRYGKGLARRSMVLGSDVGDFISFSANKEGTINLTDGAHPSFFEIENFIASFYKRKIYSLPKILLSVAVIVGDFIPFFPLNRHRFKKLSQNLTFSDDLARNNFGWKSRVVIGNFKPE